MESGAAVPFQPRRLHTRFFVPVGLDAPDVRGLLGHQDVYQTGQAGFELSGHLCMQEDLGHGHGGDGMPVLQLQAYPGS